MTEQAFMQRAIVLALEKMRTNSGGPFGAVIVRNNTIISEGWNEVTSSNDPTAHAEIVAIRRACALLGAFNTNPLSG
jgi:tRNA(Arg) A34 adenosine deaminase TadA